MKSLLDDPETADVDPKLKPLLAYARKLTLTPARMTEADAKAVYAAGWTEQTLHDACSVCCLFNFMNRLLDGHGVHGNDSVYQRRRQVMKDDWDAPYHRPPAQSACFRAAAAGGGRGAPPGSTPITARRL